MTLKIRFASEEDAETVHHFISELAAYERMPDAVEATVETLRRQMASRKPPFECLIAEERGKPVGFALFFHNYSTWRGKPGLYIEDIYVPPEFREHGIGNELIKELGCIARDRDCGRMEWAVLDWNKPAIEFYKNLGAEPLKEWIVFRITGKALEDL
ncbi:MAG: GNAT family N-acetyltransferase [Proteobacteria bacterium]|nr:GNAT family N-acetyltransferase [Pseudomonadota bacterium]